MIGLTKNCILSISAALLFSCSQQSTESERTESATSSSKTTQTNRTESTSGVIQNNRKSTVTPASSLGTVTWGGKSTQVQSTFAQWIPEENKLKVYLLTFPLSQIELDSAAKGEHFFSQPQFYYPTGKSQLPHARLDLTFSSDDLIVSDLTKLFFTGHGFDTVNSASINVTYLDSAAQAFVQQLSMQTQAVDIEMGFINTSLSQNLVVLFDLNARLYRKD